MAKRVLIVDDEQDIVIYLTALLSDAGFETEDAGNGVEAMEKAKASPPDLISLDITMPEKSGVRFYREVRADPDLAKIPVVIVTGVTNPWASPSGSGTLEDFLSTRRQVPPPDGFFEKPVDPEAYVAKVKELAGA